ncbi:MAG: hypothetical protein M5R36_01575 [Deltaproteobacteria bacterium]|nr:hypothetical protein [Deltaproteobacteria bacterium]
MIDELHKVIRRVYPNVRFRLLKVEPCVGGPLLALDEAYGKTTPAAVQKKAAATFPDVAPLI